MFPISRKFIAVHVPRLTAYAAYHSRTILDEYSPENATLQSNFALRTRSRLPQGLKRWLVRFYEEMRRPVSRKDIDAFWIWFCIVPKEPSPHDNYEIEIDNVFNLLSIEIVLSYMAHIVFTSVLSSDEIEYISKGIECVLFVVFRQVLRHRAYLTKFNSLLTSLAMGVKGNDMVKKHVLNTCLLAFPFKEEREFLVSLGADLEEISKLKTVTDQPKHPFIVAAGTGNYTFVRNYCLLLNGEFNFEGYEVARGSNYEKEYSAMSAAVESCDIDMVKLLLQVGVYKYPTFSNCEAVLLQDIQYGLRRGCLDVLRLLVPFAELSSCQNLYSCAYDVPRAAFLCEELNIPVTTSLKYVNKWHSARVVEYLLGKGSDPNDILESYKDPQLLAGADAVEICLRSATFHRPLNSCVHLMSAVRSRDAELVKLLICTMCTMEDAAFPLTLMCAAQKPNIGVSGDLIKSGADAGNLLLLFCGEVREDTVVNRRYLEWLVSKVRDIPEKMKKLFITAQALLKCNFVVDPSLFLICIDRQLAKLSDV